MVIPIKPNTDAAMLAAMAHYIWANNLHDQKFMDKFVQGLEASTMPDSAKDKENFKDYIFGKYDGQPKTPESAEPICGVKAADIKKLAQMYATTKPAALKASWSPGRNAYGEQYNRMAAAVQSMTGNIGILGGSAEGVGKGFHNEAVAYPYDEYSNVWYASIKSDRWAHCVLNYPNLKREEIGCWPRNDDLDGKIPNIKAIFWQGSDWFNQLTNINKQIEAIRKLELVVCMDSTITPSGLWADVLFPIATHFERHDVALPWYKGHYYIHRPKVIEPMGESKSDFQVFTELAYRLGFGEKLQSARHPRLLQGRHPGRRGLPQGLVGRQSHTPPGRHHALGGIQEARRLQNQAGDAPRRVPRPGRERHAVPDAVGQDRDLLERARQNHRFHQDAVRLPHPGDPQVDRAVGEPQQPEDEGTSVPSDQPASASPHPLDLQQHRLATRDLRAGGDDRRVRRRPARHQDRRHGRGVQRARPRHRAGLRHRALHARRRRAA